MFSIGKWKTKSLTVWNEFVTGMDWQAANPGSSRTTRVVTVVVCLLVCLFARFQSFDLYNYCFGEFDAVDISYQEHLTFCIIRCWIISICLNQTWLKECLYYVSLRGSRDTDSITTVPAWSYILLLQWQDKVTSANCLKRIIGQAFHIPNVFRSHALKVTCMTYTDAL